MRNRVVRARHVVRGIRARCSRIIGIRSVRTLWRTRNSVVAGPRSICVVCIVRPRCVVAGPRSVCRACIAGPRSFHCRIVCHRRITGPRHTCTMEGRWLGSGGHFWPAVVYRRPLRAVGARHLLMPSLHRSRIDVPLAQGSFLGSIGTRVDAAIATVIADAIHGDVIHYRGVVDIVDVSYVHAIDGTVVIKISTTPASAFIAVTGITVAVVDATVKAYLRTPVSGMPDVGVFAPSPVARRPQKADLRGKHPGSRYPKIAIGAVRPIAGSPDVAETRAPRLLVHRQRRRSNRHRDEYSGK